MIEISNSKALHPNPLCITDNRHTVASFADRGTALCSVALYVFPLYR